MSTKIDSFITEARNMPGFVAASATDPNWIEQLAGIERGLNAIDRAADNNPAMLDALDKIHAVISRSDLSIKQRLLAIGELLVSARDSIKIVH
jgi:hypothetical protein